MPRICINCHEEMVYGEKYYTFITRKGSGHICRDCYREYADKLIANCIPCSKCGARNACKVVKFRSAKLSTADLNFTTVFIVCGANCKRPDRRYEPE
jgi:hypothetical protein